MFREENERVVCSRLLTLMLNFKNFERVCMYFKKIQSVYATALYIFLSVCIYILYQRYKILKLYEIPRRHIVVEVNFDISYL